MEKDESGMPSGDEIEKAIDLIIGVLEKNQISQRAAIVACSAYSDILQKQLGIKFHMLESGVVPEQEEMN